jgi:MarR family transcriptional regulator, transcriptional regulator for hemolysin
LHDVSFSVRLRLRQTLDIKCFDVNRYYFEGFDRVTDMSSPPAQPPIGLQLDRTARAVSRAFGAALAAEGGSMPTWLILLSLKTRSTTNQRELAAAVGIQSATLTHHLNGLEADGLLTRRRDPANRRVHLVELTDQGDATFHRLRHIAAAHDRHLSAGLADHELDQLRGLLARLRANVTGHPASVGAPEDGPQRPRTSA